MNKCNRKYVMIVTQKLEEIQIRKERSSFVVVVARRQYNTTAQQKLTILENIYLRSIVDPHERMHQTKMQRKDENCLAYKKCSKCDMFCMFHH